MKSALTLICSLLLLWTPFVPAQSAVVNQAVSVPSCCCPGMQASCCSADSSLPESLPISAVPSVPSVHSQLLALASTVLAWTLPVAVDSIPSPVDPQFHSLGAPLYARNCVLLI
jgi:hypothetical protein